MSPVNEFIRICGIQVIVVKIDGLGFVIVVEGIVGAGPYVVADVNHLPGAGCFNIDTIIAGEECIASIVKEIYGTGFGITAVKLEWAAGVIIVAHAGAVD